MAGLRKPRLAWPCASACWFASAMNPAHNGAAALVPLAANGTPFCTIENRVSATHATSGTFRIVLEPMLEDISTPVCQLGMELVALMPPPLPSQTISEAHAPPGPAVV